jgi:hypothetical protein
LFTRNILIEFGIPMKLVRLIKICLNETYCRVQVGRHLSDMFPTKSGFKQRDVLSPLLFNFALQYAIRRHGLKLNGTHQIWFLLMMLIYWAEAYILLKNTL